MISFTHFAEKILGLKLTRAQYVVARVIFDGKDPSSLPQEYQELAGSLFGGITEVPTGARRVTVMRFGRISGKSLLCAAHALYRMVTADLSMCGPTDEPAAIVIGPRIKEAKIVLNGARNLVVGSDFLRPLLRQQQAEGFSIQRPQDGKIIKFICVPKSRGGQAGRGLSFVEIVLDESEFVAPTAAGAVIRDSDLIRAFMPRLLRGGMLILASTPWPAPSETSSLFDSNWQHPDIALCAKATTLLMRDGDSEVAALVEIERKRDPMNAAREYDVELTDADGCFFEVSNIERAVSDVVPTGSLASAGIDLAYVNDSSALVVVERQFSVVVVTLTSLVSPKPGAPLLPSAVMAQFAAEARGAGAFCAFADQHHIQSAMEDARRHQFQVAAGPTGAAQKEGAYTYVRELFRLGKLKIPRDPELIRQLKSVLSRPRSGGGLQIIQPRQGTGHADLVSALVMAVWNDRRNGPVDVDTRAVGKIQTVAPFPGFGIRTAKAGSRW